MITARTKRFSTSVATSGTAATDMGDLDAEERQALADADEDYDETILQIDHAPPPSASDLSDTQMSSSEAHVSTIRCSSSFVWC